MTFALAPVARVAVGGDVGVDALAAGVEGLDAAPGRRIRDDG